MRTKSIVTLFLTTFVAFCIAIVIDSRHKGPDAAVEQRPVAISAAQAATQESESAAATAAAAPASPEISPAAASEELVSPQPASPAPAGPADFTAIVATAPSSVTLGSSEPNSRYMFEIQFSSRGASIGRVTLSRFKDRFNKEKQLDLLSPVQQSGNQMLLSMSTGSFAMLNEKIALPLEQYDWFAGEPVMQEDGTQSVTYTASVKRAETGQVLSLAKTYTITPGQYHIDCDIAVTNLAPEAYKTRFDLHGPTGIHREDTRQDMRKIVAAYIDPKSEVVSTRVDMRKMKDGQRIEPASAQDQFIWSAVTNKYFAAIVRPVPFESDVPDWILRVVADRYAADPTLDPEGGLSFDVRTQVLDLAPAGEPGSQKVCRFQIYFGPKDKSLFDSVPLYEKLGFMQTIDFMACCCPTAIIGPIAFGILALMKWTYAFIPDYGVIIILLVLLVRLALHPITKKSQISMMGMSKLGPKAEEIKKQYANDKQEMNKRLMELYKEAGISPFMGMLPMLLQMPLWIALYSAIYASIDLRGEPFHLLWFWIKDLSAPDAVISWTPVTLPLLGTFSSLNVLPILLAIAMYLQQKLMPQQTAQSSDSAVAQQQKIMLVMMPVMMLLFLYNAPSGLNLYIMASTFGGVIEQKVIRKHIKEREEQEALGLVPATSKTGGKAKKKKPKPFFKY